MPQPLRIVALLGADSSPAKLCLQRILDIPGITLAAILIDSAPPSPAQRRRNLSRNIRREGYTYPVRRSLNALLQRLDRLANAPVTPAERDQLLHAAFPNEFHTVEALALHHHIPVICLGNLNSPEVAQRLAEIAPDLGVVLGTRILKSSTFSVPRLGSINLHKGQVPDYRGMPPGFWEVWDTQASAGVTVHFVDAGLDTGKIVLARQIPLSHVETPDTLKHKLDVLGSDTLADALILLRDDTAQPASQPFTTTKPRTRPTLAQIRQLSRRSPHLASQYKPVLYPVFKTLVYLLLVRCGLLALIRRSRSASRCAILLYHRVDDFSRDPLTISRARFAEHLLTLRRFYSVQSSAWLVERLRAGQHIPPNTVVIHFDDCYESVASAAAPLLKAAQLPATSFVSSGYIDTNRRFPHDERKYALFYPNMSSSQVQSLPSYGVSVGAHTVNHVDMGALATPAEASLELETCKRHLENLIGEPVELFSFPYGRPDNIRSEFLDLARQAQYRAVFSAHGGYVQASTDLFDIPRIGISEYHRPLDLLLELEGLTFSRIKQLLG